ncbi:hypothetical protein [Pantoea sp. 18069]|uniref:hypothetical protein n=1 Tax=Pantoea sp. 18069 TaxID=2681415 RepID=UPI0013574506|nr:hypothetical protein [Pantoea sp. 18069]
MNVNVNSKPYSPPAQLGNMATQSAADVKTPHSATIINYQSEESPMGKTQGPSAGRAESTHASPQEVSADLKKVMDDMPFDMSAILAVVRKNAQEIRKANVLARDMELKAQFNELVKSADDMKTAANYRLAAGLIQGTVQTMMAGVQLHSSAQAANEAAKGVDPQKQGQALQEEARVLNASATELESKAQAARTGTAPSTNDAVAGADHTAATIEKETAAKDQAQIEAEWEILNQDEIKTAMETDETRVAQSTPESIDEQLAADTAKSAAARVADDSVSEEANTAVGAETETAQAAAKEAAPAAKAATAEELESEASAQRMQAKDKKAEAQAKFEEVKEINAKADSIKDWWDVRSKLGEAFLGQTSIAGTKFGSEVFDVRAKRHESSAKEHESQSARASDAIQNAKEIAQDVLQKMESIEQARNDTNRAIVRNMG